MVRSFDMSVLLFTDMTQVDLFCGVVLRGHLVALLAGMSIRFVADLLQQLLCGILIRDARERGGNASQERQHGFLIGETRNERLGSPVWHHCSFCTSRE